MTADRQRRHRPTGNSRRVMANAAHRRRYGEVSDVSIGATFNEARNDMAWRQVNLMSWRLSAP